MYQLSRLLHDLHPDLYSHFDSLDIAPSLYAAPWLLTMFSSQFGLGFVARIFGMYYNNYDLRHFCGIEILRIESKFKLNLVNSEVVPDLLD